MYRKLKFFRICFLLCFVCSVGNAADNEKQKITELQVLIDVSGSMKKNDQDNLRVPAITLLINLLPEGAKVGLWLFAENTKELVKTGVVDKKWKKKALAKVKKIHSRGLFTNIEDAIQNAAQEWFKSPGQHHSRHLIILTDGVVDVSKDIMLSAESRARVMSDQIPLLQQAGVKVQTIALSDEADTELLEKLAFDTYGWSETAQSAEQLQKVFFKIFKQTVPQDTVPITGNAFSVDASIKEFSVLIFKEPGATATQLIAPDKSQINAKSKKKTVSWLNEKNYDLITIKEPKAGEWGIKAKMDPENQVMIVTDLKLVIDALPNHLILNETVKVSGFFTDQQQLISRKDFLDLIDMSIQLDKGKKWKIPAVEGKAGLFSKDIKEGLKKGRHTLKIIADGKTFKRELTKTIEVKESLVKIEKEVNLAERSVTIKLIPDKAFINTEMMAVEASISQVGRQASIQEMGEKDGQWVLVVKNTELGEHKIVNFSIIANTLEGVAISPNVAPVVVDDRLFNKTIDEPQVAESDQENSQKEIIPEKEGDDSDEIDKIDVTDKEEPINWIKTSAIVVGINVLLIALGFFGYKFMKKKSQEKQEKLLSRLD